MPRRKRDELDGSSENRSRSEASDGRTEAPPATLKLDWRDWIALTIAALETILVPVVVVVVLLVLMVIVFLHP